MASAYTIVLTVLPYIIRLPTDMSDVLNLVTVGLSIITLVASLIVASRHDAVNAEQHHRSALELNELKRDIGLLKHSHNEQMVEAKEIINQHDRYNLILQKYSINHEKIDYDALKVIRPDEYPWVTFSERAAIQIRLLWNQQISFVIMVLLTALVLWLVFGYALPNRLPRG